MDDLIYREAAINAILEVPDGNWSQKRYAQEIRKQPSVDAVPVGAYRQVRWERDIAVQQLDALGYGLGEKVVPVVRCNDCNEYQDNFHWCKLHDVEMEPMDFCSYGERKDG